MKKNAARSDSETVADFLARQPKQVRGKPVNDTTPPPPPLNPPKEPKTPMLQRPATTIRARQKPRHVNFFAHDEDHFCALYGAAGMSNKFIMGKTKLSNSAITYRLRKAGLTRANQTSRMDFRDGLSPFCDAFLNTVHTAIDKDLLAYLRDTMKH